MLPNEHEMPGIGDYAGRIHAVTQEATDAGLDIASKVLTAQAITLDSMFAELARRTACNKGVNINVVERYGRLALKAQSNCRATLEAIAKIH